MKRPQLTIGFPLLVKELTELASRRRTYVVRVAYAVLLFVAALLMFSHVFRTQYASPLAVLGSGGDMFTTIVALQFAGIYLFLPAMTCPAIASEKERDSFALLMLTRLGPWTILLEKLIGRLIPMFTFLLLALPLMGFAYTYGGIESEQVWGAIWMLGLTALQVATLCLMCSSYCRTTVGAFLAANLLGAAMFFVLPAIFAALWQDPLEEIALAMMPPYSFFKMFGGGARTMSIWTELMLRSCPIVFTSMLFFAIARYYLVRRAFAQPRHLIRRIFKGLDKIFFMMNDNVITQGVVLVKENATLPVSTPVAWRETTKKNLGQFRYLVRILLVLELPIVGVGLLALIDFGRYRVQLTLMSAMLFLLWTITTLVLTVQAASLVSGERSRQTLDALLTTPLSGEEILKQKVAGLRRLLWVLAICFMTVFLFETWYYFGMGFDRQVNLRASEPFLHYFSSVRYLLTSILTIAVNLPLIVWLGLWIGLKFKSQTRAIMGALAVLVVWGVVTPIILASLSDAFAPSLNENLVILTSPFGIVYVNEYNDFGRDQGLFPGTHRDGFFRWAVVLGNFAFYGAILYALRAKCLRHADQLLGRREDLAVSPPPPAAAPPPAEELQPAVSH